MAAGSCEEHMGDGLLCPAPPGLREQVSVTEERRETRTQKNEITRCYFAIGQICTNRQETASKVILLIQLYSEPSLCEDFSVNFSMHHRSILALLSVNVGDLLWRQRGSFSDTESLSNIGCLNVIFILNKAGIGGTWREGDAFIDEEFVYIYLIEHSLQFMTQAGNTQAGSWARYPCL